MKLSFFGAAGTVTGSRYLIETKGKKILIDCGLFQGFKDRRSRNWDDFGVDASEIHAVILTHAHIDHSGYLPRLVKQGFKGRVYCTPPTRDLCEVMLLDCGYLQEEDARRANKYGYSQHTPAVPLYTVEEARTSLKQFTPHPFGTTLEIAENIHVQFERAGHIPGAAWVKIKAENRSVLFSGDQGRPHDLLMKASTKPTNDVDYLVIESTYGDRLHELPNPVDQFGALINKTVQRGGTIIIPSFAVGRAQSLIHYIHKLKTNLKINPLIPVYLDSPMAISATEILKKHTNEHRLSHAACDALFESVHFVQTPEESRSLSQNRMPKIIIAGAGMMVGGRVLRHVEALGGNYRNMIIFAGYQAEGTRGNRLLRGEREIKIFGQMMPIHAEITLLKGASAHADCMELIDWLGHIKKAPITTFITHGEPKASTAMGEQLLAVHPDWKIAIPAHGETYTL